MSRIVDFYRGEARHPLGVAIETIWGWNDRQLEDEHTYIQWLFPLQEPSRAVPGSPTIGDADAEVFQQDPDLRKRLLRSFKLMLNFYGFAVSEPSAGRGEVSITTGGDFAVKGRRWLTRQNHNHLRITRILKSSVLLGLKREAIQWFAELQRVYAAHAGIIGPATYEYWRNAIERGTPRPDLAYPRICPAMPAMPK